MYFYDIDGFLFLVDVKNNLVFPFFGIAIRDEA